MRGPGQRTRDAELLLARISEAAGRARLGRRLATYPGSPRRADRRPCGAAVFVLFGRWLVGTAARRTGGARLDLYEHGLTVAVQGEIHTVRYDSTSVRQHCAGHALTDVDGRPVPCGRFRDAQRWWPEILRAVTAAQLPLALAALDNGERLSFGTLWMSRERLGSPHLSAPWTLIQRIEVRSGSLQLTIDGTRHDLGTPATDIPNLTVVRALAERLCVR
jgi:hypothetical protein